MDFDEDRLERERKLRRTQRIREMKRRKQIQMLVRRLIALGMIVLVVAAAIALLTGRGKRPLSSNEEVQDETLTNTNATTSFDQIQDTDNTLSTGEETDDEIENTTDSSEEDEGQKQIYSAQTTEATIQPGGDIVSGNVILIDEDEQAILVQRASSAIICPASMTKILTVLVAAEHVTDLNDTFTITLDITDYSYVHDCSNVGFARDEKVTIRDLFYGTVLPSGADAAVGLATYVAGSQEAFVELMNKKLVELGLSETAHFTNCVGLYEEDHYCTVYDMAMILKAALDNELCKEVLSTHTYTTSSTTEHPEEITISNWFLRRIEDKDCGGTVLCGKTGYVVESGNCAASYAVDENGKGYICVTADATSGWKCIYDQVALYKQFLDTEAEEELK